MRVRFKLLRVGYDAQMLATNDLVTYPDVYALKKKLAYDIKIYKQIAQALVFGSHEFGVHFEKLPDTIKDAMFSHDFMGEKESLNMMENIIIHSSLSILNSPEFPIRNTDEDFIRLQERMPVAYNAYEKVAHADEVILEEEIELVVVTSVVMFFATIGGLALIFFGLFRPLLSGLRFEHEKTKRLLYQIPLECVKQNYPLQILLRGKEAALDMFEQNDVEGIRFTKDGS